MFSRSKGGYRGVAEPDTKLVSRFKAGGVAVLYVEGLSVAAFAATISRWVSPFWSDPWNPWVPSNPRECQKSCALARML